MATVMINKTSENTPICPLWTKQGLKNLGKLIYASRVSQGLSLDEVATKIKEKIGDKLTPTKKTINNVENGIGEPKYNTIAAITAAEIIIDKQGNPYDILNILNIASEKITPELPTMKTIEQNNLTLEEIKTQIYAHEKYLSFRKFKSFFYGIETPNLNHELSILRLICDPSDIFSEEEWIRAAKRDALLKHSKQ